MADLFGFDASENDEALPVPSRPPLVLQPAKVRGKHYIEPRGYAAPPGAGPAGKTCRDCANFTHGGTGRRSFPKCGLNQARWTSGRGSDILASAPACRLFEEPAAD
jgi:hypothetical protein